MPLLRRSNKNLGLFYLRCCRASFQNCISPQLKTISLSTNVSCPVLVNTVFFDSLTTTPPETSFEFEIIVLPFNFSNSRALPKLCGKTAAISLLPSLSSSFFFLPFGKFSATVHIAPPLFLFQWRLRRRRFRSMEVAAGEGKKLVFPYNLTGRKSLSFGVIAEFEFGAN